MHTAEELQFVNYGDDEIEFFEALDILRSYVNIAVGPDVLDIGNPGVAPTGAYDEYIQLKQFEDRQADITAYYVPQIYIHSGVEPATFVCGVHIPINVIGWTGNSNGLFIGILETTLNCNPLSKTLPHELGHELGLVDILAPTSNLMVSQGSGSKLTSTQCNNAWNSNNLRNSP